MTSMRERMVEALDDERGGAAADRLCTACVALLDVEAAAMSLMYDSAANEKLGASGWLGTTCDEAQFTTGEGPCRDALANGAPVLVADLADPHGQRWPAFGPALLALDIHAVFAVPIALDGQYVGALTLFRKAPGMLHPDHVAGAMCAAELAELPLLDLVRADLDAAVNDPDSDAWAELHALARDEMAEATGMLSAQLDMSPTDALARLRAHAYATGRSATEVARDISQRRLRLGPT